MTKEDAVARLKAHEVELRAMGVARLSLFGSMARGEQTATSDVDVAAAFDRSERPFTAFDFGRVESRLTTILGARVDLLGEPARRAAMQLEIDRDRVHVF